jgi:hypothetical protein
MMITSISIELAMRPSAGANGCLLFPVGLNGFPRPAGPDSGIRGCQEAGPDISRQFGGLLGPGRDHGGRPCGPSCNSTYLPPSPVSEIPRIRYRCKAIARAAVGIIEIVDAAMMSCH